MAGPLFCIVPVFGSVPVGLFSVLLCEAAIAQVSKPDADFGVR